MILSRLWLNPRSRLVQQDLADCQAMHRRLLSAFADDIGGRAGAGLLYRIEPAAAGRPLTLLAQSLVMPDWTRLPEGWLLPVAGNPALSDLGAVLDRIGVGMRFRFRLRANATRKIDTKSGPDGARRNGRRVPVRGDEGRLRWIASKAQEAGFAIETVRASAESAAAPVLAVDARPEPVVRGWRPGGAGEMRRLTLASVLYEGVLRVTDPSAFRNAIGAGIGPGKAYGMGLLSIAPLE
ncbi:MAG: type I-E CRISPR-associated protein Cas6/Cse3/CasE [Dehalococcoidia bacterium]|nr:type I-E CRISPR-associated protein Cas6/Cse3/CasE [Dehalococcoidia bacterium]